MRVLAQKITRPMAAKAVGQARPRARYPHRAVRPNAPATANWAGPKDGNHCRTGLPAEQFLGLAQAGQPPGGGELTQVLADGHGVIQHRALRAVARRGMRGVWPVRPPGLAGRGLRFMLVAR